jgi:DTW domain-containing protein
MASRSRSKQRCLDCKSFVPLCICSIAPRFHLQTRVVILMHRRELTLTTSTALLAKLTLSNFELRVRGILDEPMSNADLTPDERQALVLYPSDEAQELNPDYLTKLTKPISLIVLDGNWRQAAKMSSRIAELRDVPRVKLPVGAPSEFRLRRAHREDGMSTFEAIARSLGIIEGAKVQRELEAIFKIRVERTLWSRGQLAPEHCTGGVPEAAFLAHYLAGCSGGPKPRSPRTEA